MGASRIHRLFLVSEDSPLIDYNRGTKPVAERFTLVATLPAMPGAPPKKDRKEYNEAQELENLQRVFDRLDKKGDKKITMRVVTSDNVAFITSAKIDFGQGDDGQPPPEAAHALAEVLVEGRLLCDITFTHPRRAKAAIQAPSPLWYKKIAQIQASTGPEINFLTKPRPIPAFPPMGLGVSTKKRGFCDNFFRVKIVWTPLTKQRGVWVDRAAVGRVATS